MARQPATLMSAWAQTIASGLIAIVSAFGVAVFYIGPQRKKYLAEASGSEATAASTLSGAALAQLNAAMDRAARAETKADAADQRADKAERRADRLEDELRTEQRRRVEDVRAVRRDLESLVVVIRRPVVATAIEQSGGMPELRLVFDTDA